LFSSGNRALLNTETVPSPTRMRDPLLILDEFMKEIRDRRVRYLRVADKRLTNISTQEACVKKSTTYHKLCSG
jgi:hypothetical protein